jgi:peroxiredoxin (alkyl hydroperoxide reductase subunit C)
VLGSGEIVEQFNFLSEKADCYAALVFYPLDFTFVCPTELIALDKRIDEFEQRGVLVMGISVDSEYAHHAWRSAPIERGGVGPVRFPLVADSAHSICRAYGVEAADGKVALRAAFLIDRSNIVRHQVVNDLPLGRNIDELLRMVDALQFYERHGEVCPAGWSKEHPGITATAEGVAAYLSQHAGAL